MGGNYLGAWYQERLFLARWGHVLCLSSLLSFSPVTLVANGQAIPQPSVILMSVCSSRDGNPSAVSSCDVAWIFWRVSSPLMYREFNANFYTMHRIHKFTYHTSLLLQHTRTSLSQFPARYLLSNNFLRSPRYLWFHGQTSKFWRVGQVFHARRHWVRSYWRKTCHIFAIFSFKAKYLIWHTKV